MPGRRRRCPTSAGSASTRRTASASSDAYVRVAVGLDYLGAAPIRGSRTGGGSETLAVSLRVEDVRLRRRAETQAQSQSQADQRRAASGRWRTPELLPADEDVAREIVPGFRPVAARGRRNATRTD